MESFKGGIALHDHRGLQLRGIADYKKVYKIQPKRVYIPVQQHIGKPAEVIVSVGDVVFLGQKIAKNGEGLGEAIHASVSGKVVEIAEKDQGQGEAKLCIIIENDFKETLDPNVVHYDHADVEEWPREAIIEKVEDAGVVGLGGATFPSHVKLNPKEDIHTCIFNGAECEPLLMADAALMVTDSLELLEGCLIVMKAVGAKEGYIGIEDDKQEAIEVMSTLCEPYDHLHVVAVPSIYPQGSSEMLVHTITGKEVPVGGSSRDMGILVINVATTASVYEALSPGIPLIHRICSVVGDVVEPKNILFPLGTRACELIEACGGFVGDPSKVIMGGFMMGKTLDTIESSLTKAANGLVVINKQHDQSRQAMPCIRCGRCVDVCPIRLLPHQLEYYYLKGRIDRLEKLHAESCINCGCCSYICPAKRDLAENITKGARKVKEANR